MPEENKKTSFGRELWEMLRIVIISLLIVLPIRFFVAQPFIVRGASMEPNFEDGEYLVIDELSYRIGTPLRGQIVIFRYPRDPSQFFIKRIIGLPGETVIIEDGHVSVQKGSESAMKLDESYLRPGLRTGPDATVELGSNEYFVLGDNRTNSSDSRVWGNLRRDFMIGRALVRLWPISRVSLL